MNPPYTVLGVYHPPIWNTARIGLDLTALTRAHGLVPHVDPAHGPLERAAWRSVELHAEVRRRTFRTKQAEDWHQDGDLTASARMDCGIVLWCSNNPTQIKRRGRVEIYQPMPWDVILFSNMECQHRRPPNCPRIRWVFRQRVIAPSYT